MWGCFLMSGLKILHFLKDWWKSIPIHQNYTMALMMTFFMNRKGPLYKCVFQVAKYYSAKLIEDDCDEFVCNHDLEMDILSVVWQFVVRHKDLSLISV